MKAGDKIVVLNDVMGYYVKEPCKVQMSIMLPKRSTGTVVAVTKIEVSVYLGDSMRTVWIPKDALEIQK